jgi:hypothetical protein
MRYRSRVKTPVGPPLYEMVDTTPRRTTVVLASTRGCAWAETA